MASNPVTFAALRPCMVAGEEVGDIHIANRTYDVNVWSIPEARNSLNALRELLIDTPDGGHVQLQDVADVRITPTPNVVNREDGKRRTDVNANVRGRPLGDVYARRRGRPGNGRIPARVLSGTDG